MTEGSDVLPSLINQNLVRLIGKTIFVMTIVLGPSQSPVAEAQIASPAKSTTGTQCLVEAIDYKGWKAQQVSNRWVQLVIVPQNGGRLMQVTFNGHDYLFVNPKLAGKHMPPSQTQWFNYGGDKIWLLPEGDDDEQHWRGNSDLLDDGAFSFRKLSDEKGCGMELTGLPDPHTGVQITRTIRLEPDSPHIAFRAFMKNISGHTLEWSMQSVSQYDTGNATDPAHRNPDIWAFTPANPASAYLNRYHVRTGIAENPAASVREDGLFAVHYSHLATEFWIDSTAGWVAVVDGANRYAMVERFQYDEHTPYPGKASVIFWTNGVHLNFNNEGEASVSDGPNGPSPFYMEAEINSPMCHLRPGEACQLETDWFPTRADSEFYGVTEAGTLIKPLQAMRLESGKVKLSGSFGVFFSGKLVAHFYDEHGASTEALTVAEVSPNDLVVLDKEISSSGKPGRVSLHLEDQNGLDRGALGEIPIK
jgi:hypothetical protein